MTWWEEVAARLAGVLLGGWLLIAVAVFLMFVAWQVSKVVERRRWTHPEEFVGADEPTVVLPRQRRGERP